jgi:flagellin-like hook-associated protein FlgL
VQSLRANSNLSSFVRRSFDDKSYDVGRSIEKLSSGLSVRRASDNSSGLAISESVRRQISALNSATSNNLSVQSVLQTIDGGLSDAADILSRMKELTVEARNGALSQSQRSAIATELMSLANAIEDVSRTTKFGQLPVLSTSFATLDHSAFVSPDQVVGSSTSTMRSTTFDLFGTSETASTPATASIVSMQGVSSEDWASGHYVLSSNGSELVLTESGGASQAIVLVSGAPTAANQVRISSAVGDVMTFDFDELGVTLTIGTDRKGSNHTPSEVATLVASIGTKPDPALRSKWEVVDGAAWEHPFDAATYPAGVKVVVTASEGTLRLDSDTLTSLTSGANTISSVRGYNGAAADGSDVTAAWTGGAATSIAFTGSQEEAAVLLASLESNTPSGRDSISVSIVPKNISLNVNADGSVSYYQIGSAPGGILWSAADAAASGSTFAGLAGYLSNVTSASESTFLRQKLGQNGWIGASDYLANVNAAITARNAATGETTPLYADQAAVEGHWYWVDGPEIGLEFYNEATHTNVSGGVGQVTTPYSDWAGGEPNNSGGDEGYAYLIGGSSWNDYRWNNSAVTSYVIEYGGAQGLIANTNKTISLGIPTTIDIGRPVAVSDVQLSGGLDGRYELSTDANHAGVTLRRYNDSSNELLSEQTLNVDTTLEEGESRALSFDQMGVTLKVSNQWDHEVDLRANDAGLTGGLVVANNTSSTAIEGSTLGFQDGVMNRHTLVSGESMNLSLEGNSDERFTRLGDSIGALALDDHITDEELASVQQQIVDVMGAVESKRTSIGSAINAIDRTTNVLGIQRQGFSAALGNIVDTDYATETARMARLQIGQQTAAAMLAQVNLLPNVASQLLSL